MWGWGEGVEGGVGWVGVVAGPRCGMVQTDLFDLRSETSGSEMLS